MRCKNCGYRLWNLPSRTCPECGTDFLPSQYEFNANSVQFCCPHCNSVYYGTSDKGHLVPIEFECAGCRRRIHMDEMILLPTAGVDEQRTQVDRIPWLERRERGFVRAWFATIGMALVQPGRLMRALPDTGNPRAAWRFAILTNTPSLLIGMGLIVVFPMIIAFASSGPTAAPDILLGVLFPLAIATVLAAAFTMIIVLLWGLVAHGMLRATGATHGPLSRTYEALCYSTGANVGTAIPCLGFYIGWIWWLVSAVVMVKVAQKVRGWRAAFAVLLLPGVSMAIVGGLYAWLIYSVLSTSGGWAAADAERRTNLVTGALIAYAQANTGQGPAHAFELITSGNLLPEDFVTVAHRTAFEPGRVKSAVPSSHEFARMSSSEQRVATNAAIAALPSGAAAHRLGEFVFVYHGIDFKACDGRLWIVVWSPDPADISVQRSWDRVLIVYCDGRVEAVDAANFDTALVEQNEVRRANDLPPLSDPHSIAQSPNQAIP